MPPLPARCELEEQGADIIDIGAESTRPGSERINAGEELRRLIPVLKRLKGKLEHPDLRGYLQSRGCREGAGARRIHHQRRLGSDVGARSGETVVKYDAGLILNHMRGTPETWAKLGPMKDVMGSLLAELEAAIHRAVARRCGPRSHRDRSWHRLWQAR